MVTIRVLYGLLKGFLFGFFLIRFWIQDVGFRGLGFRARGA